MIIIIEKSEIPVCKAILERHLESWEGSHVIEVEKTNEETIKIGYDASILLVCYPEYDEEEYKEKISSEELLRAFNSIPNGGILRIVDRVIEIYPKLLNNDRRANL